MTMDDPDDVVRVRLTRIARTLDLPPDYFFRRAATEGDAAEANECLRLWCRIRTPQGRRRALETLRSLGDPEDG